jgi:hypothetical protein
MYVVHNLQQEFHGMTSLRLDLLGTFCVKILYHYDLKVIIVVIIDRLTTTGPAILGIRP